MSQLVLTLLQLGFLLLLWFLVFSVIGVMRTDIYGTRLVTRGQRAGARRRAEPARAAAQPPRPPMPTKLVVTEGPLRGRTVPLERSAVVIGRASDSTLVLEDDFASSRHARLTPGHEGWVVEDLGSTNGTLLNGGPLEGPALVPPGTVLQIGKTVLELRR